MHSAILYATFPELDSQVTRQRISSFLAAIRTIEDNKSVVQLGEFVWEVNFREAPNALAVLVRACEQLAVPYGILPLDAAPQWIRQSPNGTSR